MYLEITRVKHNSEAREKRIEKFGLSLTIQRKKKQRALQILKWEIEGRGKKIIGFQGIKKFNFRWVHDLQNQREIEVFQEKQKKEIAK